MKEISWIQTLSPVVALLGACLGAGIAVFFSGHQKKKSWLDTFNAVHSSFWSDPDFQRIRKCIAYDSAYVELANALDKRSKDAPLSVQEMDLIDNLDKFLNLLSRVTRLGQEYKGFADLWRKLYFDWWFEHCFEPNRTEVAGYIARHYEDSLLAPHSRQDPKRMLERQAG
ncbi:MAG: hypothetical protein HY901_12925 [Deltaproteobacteria bacterium]|nr:hypothetical protein [Deltaproteobacteria bacterium]